MKRILFVLLTLVVFSCNEEKSEETSAYEIEMFSWFTDNYESIQKVSDTKRSDVWYLYFDDQLTCETCKMRILSQVREEKSIIILTSFSNENLLKAFKGAYRLDNRIINFPDNRRKLKVPFLFQIDGDRFYNWTIFNNENLEDDLVDFMVDQ